jgi:hypothetical protein
MTSSSSLEGDLSARLNQVIIVLFYPLGSTLFSLFITYSRYLRYLCIEQSVLRIRYVHFWLHFEGY